MALLLLGADDVSFRNRRVGVQEKHRPLSGVEFAPQARVGDGRDVAVELDVNAMSLLISYSPVSFPILREVLVQADDCRHLKTCPQLPTPIVTLVA
jgi:hypothetical protein